MAIFRFELDPITRPSNVAVARLLLAPFGQHRIPEDGHGAKLPAICQSIVDALWTNRDPRERRQELSILVNDLIRALRFASGVHEIGGTLDLPSTSGTWITLRATAGLTLRFGKKSDDFFIRFEISTPVRDALVSTIGIAIAVTSVRHSSGDEVQAIIEDACKLYLGYLPTVRPRAELAPVGRISVSIDGNEDRAEGFADIVSTFTDTFFDLTPTWDPSNVRNAAKQVFHSLPTAGRPCDVEQLETGLSRLIGASTESELARTDVSIHRGSACITIARSSNGNDPRMRIVSEVGDPLVRIRFTGIRNQEAIALLGLTIAHTAHINENTPITAIADTRARPVEAALWLALACSTENAQTVSA